MIKNSFIRFSCIAFAIAGFASAAYAAPVTVDLGWASYSISEGAVPVGNIDLQSLPADTGNFLANYSVSGVNMQFVGADIVTGNDKTGLFQHIKPSGVGNNQHYLAVFGLSPYLPGHAIFTLGSGITQFGFNWGSIDAYNFLTVTNGANKIYTISGADLIAAVNAINPGKTSRYFGLIDLAGITRIVLSSSWSAFEVADISVVPLPAALSLFGASLAGLIFVGRRKAKSKN